jgi:sensor histidine kinase YesM
LIIASLHTLIRQNTYLISESRTKIQGELDQKYQAIYERFKKASSTCDYINSILPDLWEFEQSSGNDTIPYMEQYDNIKAQLTKAASYNNFIDQIIVVSDSFTIVSDSSRNVIFQNDREIMGLLEAEYEKTAGNYNNTQFTRVIYPTTENETSYIKGEYGIQKPMYKDDELVGWFIVIFDQSFFKDITDEEILILNEEGDKAYGNESAYKSYLSIKSASELDAEENDIDIYETRNQFVMQKQIAQTQMSIAMVKNIGQTNVLSNYISIIATAAISLILAILLSKVASDQITVPLRKLKSNVDNYNLHKSKSIKESESSGKTERKQSLRESILMYLIIVLFLPSALFVLSSYVLSLNNFNKGIQESYMTSVEGAVNNINTYMEDKEKILRIIIYDSLVQDKLYDEESGEDISLNVNRAVKMGGAKNSIKLYDRDAKEIYTNDNSEAGYLLFPEEVNNIMSGRAIYNWNSTELNLYNQYEYSILVKINSLEHFENIGYLKTWIPEIELEKIYEDLSRAGITINILDENDLIVSSEKKELIGTKYIENTDLEFEEHLYDLGYGNWTLAAKYSKSISPITRNGLILERLYLLILILLTTIVIAFIISSYLTKWITIINRLIKKTRLGAGDITFPENLLVYEFAELGKSFNEMITSNKELANQIVETTKRAVEMEDLGKKSELKALQFQINSHFIYNTFDGIVWLIKSNRSKDAVLMLTYLSKFLRYVARTDSPIVKVEEEVEHVKNYVSLINMRFDDKIQFYWNIDDNVLDYQIIRLSIQPIIENAIFHGIYPLDGIGIIEINCYKDNDYLYVNVSDDGCGIGKQNLNDLIKNINEQDAKNSIGLHNIQSRIKLYFGEEYGIEITSKVNAGTSVTIKLPLRLYKDESTPASEIQDI